MVRHGDGRRQAQSLANLLEMFTGPQEGWLDDQLDRSLVRTFFLALPAMRWWTRRGPLATDRSSNLTSL